MSDSDSLPPEEATAHTMRLRDLRLQVEALTRLLLGLEGAIRELIGEVRADRHARAADASRASQPHPISSAAVATLQAIAVDPTARAWVGRSLAVVIVAFAIGCLAYVDVAAASPLSGIFSIADHYLSPGKP